MILSLQHAGLGLGVQRQIVRVLILLLLLTGLLTRSLPQFPHV